VWFVQKLRCFSWMDSWGDAVLAVAFDCRCTTCVHSQSASAADIPVTQRNTLTIEEVVYLAAQQQAVADACRICINASAELAHGIGCLACQCVPVARLFMY
jgi:hypothetical protein